jgi:hypothetical protein
MPTAVPYRYSTVGVRTYKTTGSSVFGPVKLKDKEAKRKDKEAQPKTVDTHEDKPLTYDEGTVLAEQLTANFF